MDGNNTRSMLPLQYQANRAPSQDQNIDARLIHLINKYGAETFLRMMGAGAGALKGMNDVGVPLAGAGAIGGAAVGGAPGALIGAAGGLGLGALGGGVMGYNNMGEMIGDARINSQMPPPPTYGAQPPLESQMPPVPDYPPHVPPSQSALRMYKGR